MVKLEGWGKKETIKKTEKENCQIVIWQRYYTNEMTRDSTKNIGDS